jgi:hypothetical protein
MNSEMARQFVWLLMQTRAEALGEKMIEPKWARLSIEKT